MQISPISFSHTKSRKKENTKTSYAQINTQEKNNVSLIEYPKPQIQNILENYSVAKRTFQNNLEEGYGIFGEQQNISSLMENDKIRRNVVKFFAQYSKEEIERLNAKETLTENETEYRNSLEEVNKFFSEYIDSWPLEKIYENQQISSPRKLAFAGRMSSEDEKNCKNIVHCFSAACGAISAAMGEGAAIGADTPFIRTAQLAMFSTMAYKLKVPPIPSAEYYLKEMCQGATLGVGGAKLVTSWLGIAGHAATGATGTSTATGGSINGVISGGVKAVNGTLSALITEKMGRGYIRRVKENRMTFKNQTVELGSYFIARGVFAHENPLSQLYKVDFKDASSPELIKDAILKMPDSYQMATSSLLKILSRNTLTVGELFVANFALSTITTGEKDPEELKKMASEIFKNCLIQSVSYELANSVVKADISKEATQTVLEIQKNLEKYPEVFRMFVNKEHEFFENINIETLKYDEFTNQFTNRVFVNNLSRFCREMIREIQYTWVNKERDKNSSDLSEIAKKMNTAIQNGEKIDDKLTEKEKEELDKTLEELKRIFAIQTDYMKLKDNFGFGRIAGYEEIKANLTEKFITPISLKDTPIQTQIPSTILLYGPTDVGKTELAKATIEQAKCKMVPFSDVSSLKELEDFLEKTFKTAKTASRHYVIHIDEFDDFCDDEETIQIFKKYIEKAPQNNISFIFTSNNPLDIDKEILKQSINIPIGPADEENTTHILKHYIDELNEEDCKEIYKELQNNSKNGVYSNAQIKNMCLIIKASKVENIKEKMLQLIKSRKPEIRQKNIDKFIKEQEEIRNICQSENSTLQ